MAPNLSFATLMTRSAMTGENKVSMLRPLSVLPRQNRLHNVIQHPAEKNTNNEPTVDERNPSVPFHRVFSPQLPPVPQLPQSWEKIVVVFIQTDITKFPQGASEQSLVAIWACHLSVCMIMLIMTNYMHIIWKTVKRCSYIKIYVSKQYNLTDRICTYILIA